MALEKKKKETVTRPPIVLSEITLKQVASAHIMGESQASICSRLKLSPYQYTALVNDVRFEEIVRKIGEDDTITGIAAARRDISRKLPKAIAAIEHHLDKHSLEAAKMVLKAVGLDEAKGTESDTSVTVVLPGATHEKASRTIEITSDNQVKSHGSETKT